MAYSSLRMKTSHFMLLWSEVTVESADSCTNDTWLLQYFRTTEAFAADRDVKTDWELASRVRGVKLPQVHRQHEQTSRRACGIETSALMTEQVTETTDTSTKGASAAAQSRISQPLFAGL